MFLINGIRDRNDLRHFLNFYIYSKCCRSVERDNKGGIFFFELALFIPPTDHHVGTSPFCRKSENWFLGKIKCELYWCR